MIRCVCDRCEMENGVESFVAEFLSPVECRQVLRDEIAAVSGEIFEITGSKIINYSETRVRKFFLQRNCEIGSDETGAASNNQVQSRISRVHKKDLLAW